MNSNYNAVFNFKFRFGWAHWIPLLTGPIIDWREFEVALQCAAAFEQTDAHLFGIGPIEFDLFAEQWLFIGAECKMARGEWFFLYDFKMR